jgi:hypothetical protein
MDVVWQDSVGSFLDSSGTDPGNFASFASDGSGALWSSAGDSPLFSGQPVLWESGADSPADSHISALTADGTGGNDSGALLVGSWLADASAGSAGASPAMNLSLLWAGSGSDTSSTLASNGGVGLGALDLGAGSAASQWFQSLNVSAPQETWLQQPANLVWTGGTDQAPLTTSTPLMPPVGNLQVPGAPSLQAPPTLTPQQLVWTDSSQGVAGITSSPATLGAAPTPLFNLGGPTQPSSGPFNLTQPQTTA